MEPIVESDGEQLLLSGAGKRALKQQQVWVIRFWLAQLRRLRDRALFDFAIDSKLRDCDVVKVRIGDVVLGGRVRDRATVVQQKTKCPVQFELTETARKTVRAWLERRGGTLNDFVFPSRNDYMGHISTRQYARLVHEWVKAAGIWDAFASTHQGVHHPQGYGQFARRPDLARPCQKRKHRPVPWR